MSQHRNRQPARGNVPEPGFAVRRSREQEPTVWTESQVQDPPFLDQRLGTVLFRRQVPESGHGVPIAAGAGGDRGLAIAADGHGLHRALVSLGSVH